jgi:hypothetical protein
MSEGRYSSARVRGMLESYAYWVRRVRAGEATSAVESELRWLEAALARMPEPLYEVLWLRTMLGLSNLEIAARLGRHSNTTSRRFHAALAWLAGFLNSPEISPPLRKLDWRRTVPDSPPTVPVSTSRKVVDRGGRPQRIPLALDIKVVRLYCMGLTQQEIADRLNEAGVPAVGREWRRSSIRTILRRYGAPARPPGRRFKPERMGLGSITGRVDYRTTMFGEPLCDADALLRRRGVDPSHVARE